MREILHQGQLHKSLEPLG